MRLAIRATIGNFNFWEGPEGRITWPEGLGGSAWFEVATGKRSVKEFNLSPLREAFLIVGEAFWKNTPLSIHETPIQNPSWWTRLTECYGNDPLRKRETLLYIILYDLGWDAVPPMQGCIDYNVIIALRHKGIITGFDGNEFNETEETLLRMECLVAIMNILNIRQDLTISMMDQELYLGGKWIRKHDPNWEKHMCYRPGCYYY